MSELRLLQVGDIIFIEQAWEDAMGFYHDEFAQVKSIDNDGRLHLLFDEEEVTTFLDGMDFFEKDYRTERLDMG